MGIHADEITNILKERLAGFSPKTEMAEIGKILQVGDGIAHIYGLTHAMAGEVIEFSNGTYGMVLNLEEDNVGCIILGPYTELREGDIAKRTGRIVDLPVGEGLIGRVVNAIGDPLDGQGPVQFEEYYPMETPAPGVLDRKSVNRPLQTGIIAIDSLVPIGRGQRELIIGDRQTGKTAIAIDTIINQKDKDVICIYVAIGQKQSTVVGIIKDLRELGAMEYTTIVVASASEPAPMLYIAPYAGCAIGEYFMKQGKDVLIIYDDLTKHAVAYREISLLLKRPPGREAFPGDVFYLHSRLLERSAQLSDELGAGSMTALPIVETQAGDVSAYIPTNIISITDGQIFLEADLFFAGIRPAINPGISVSRVGGAAQTKPMKQVSGTLRIDLAQYREMAAFAQFGSDLDKTTKEKLDRGIRIMEVLKQGRYTPYKVGEQVLMLYTVNKGFLDKIAVNKINNCLKAMSEYLQHSDPALLEMLGGSEKLSEDFMYDKLEHVIKDFLATYRAK